MNMKTGMFAIALTGLFAAGNVNAEIITTDNVIENALFSNEGGSRLDGWTLEVGSPQFGARADGYYIRGGANYENNMRISQVVSFEDLNINTSVIDAGLADLTLSAYLWSYAGKDDARVRLYYMDENMNHVEGNPSQIYGWYDDATSPKYFEGTVTIPTDSRYLLIYVEANRDYGSGNNGYIYNPSATISYDSEELALAGFKDLYNDVSLPLLGFGLLPGLFMFAGRRKGRKVA